MKATLGQIRIAIGEIVTTEQGPDGVFVPGPLTRLGEVSLPIRTAFRVKRVTDAARSEYDRTQKLRDDLVRKHGSERPEAEGGGWQVLPEAMVAYFTEYSELLATEVELPAELHQLTVDDLEGVQLSGNDLTSLGWFIVEAAPEAKSAPISQISDKRKKKAQAAA